MAPKSTIWRTRASVRLGAAGHVQHADLLHRVVKSPEADERAVPERDVGGVDRPDAAAPDPVAPHLGDPRPVLARVERAQRPAAGRAGRRVDPNRPLAADRRDLAVRRTEPPARPSSRRGSGTACGAGRRACSAAPGRTARRRTAAGTRGCAPPPTRTGVAAWRAGAPRSAPDRGSRSWGSSTGSPSPPARRENT